MIKEYRIQEFRLKNIDQARNHFIKEIDQNDLMSKKHKKVWVALNYTEHFLILASAVTGCSSVPAFAFLVGIPRGIANSALGLQICAIIIVNN